ncbi:MAG: FG-GAP repeat protein, partial [SAR202 cluster bacterium]|nr:FG-GAP repeat protein [SAR202 cluster bacterium]
MKKYYVTQSCKKFTPILNIFYKNLKLLDFFDGLVVYTDDNKFSPSDSFIKVIHGKDISYSDNLKIAVKSCSEDCFFCGCDDYIFYKDQGGTDNWGQQKKLTASDAGPNEQFGYSVSISTNYVVIGEALD